MPRGRSSDIEADIRTRDALSELSGDSGKEGVEAEEGVYGAKGDPWVYKVIDGKVMVLNTVTGQDWTPAPKAAEAAIQAQMDSGQLTLGGGAATAPSLSSPEEQEEFARVQGPEGELAQEFNSDVRNMAEFELAAEGATPKGAPSLPQNPWDVASEPPDSFAKRLREGAAKKALGGS